MLSAEVHITGDAKFMSKLEKLAPALSDFKDALKLIGDNLVSYYKGQAFDSKGGVFGAVWPDLAPSTVDYKTSHYRTYAAFPLIATGTMRNDDWSSKPEPLKLEITNTAPYFVYHQSSADRTKIPRRQMIGVNSRVKTTIKGIITADIEAKIGLL